MIRLFSLMLLGTLYACAGEKLLISPPVALGGLLLIIGLFFGGIYKAVKTQKIQYAWALLPFGLLLAVMFFM